MNKIKKNDKVLVLSGNYKGNKSIILKIFSKKNKAIVRGLNIVKKHLKPNIKNPKGGIIEKEAPIHISNLKKINEEKEAPIINNDDLKNK
ncbi:50S ribosomal protein L24 [Blattabacterium cuenoti]|uniref:50S ribosomal protein L24 n=1 Tax=Blattabacterium cuenoti TaxID=1653831 RepID=UPI00163C80C6|nr:50S ribosomal protein L24 [Blattabacterium cuenoti]